MFGLTHIANSQGCEQILFGGVFNTFNEQGSSYSNAEWHNAWCNGTLSTSSSGGSTSVNLTLPIGDIPIGIGLSDAQEFQRVYKQTFCSTGSSAAVNYSTNASIVKVASPDILKSYTDCKAIEAKGLKVDFSLRPEDNKVFVISVTWGGAVGTPKVKKIIFLPNVVSGQSGSLIEGLTLEKNQSYALVAERTTDVPMTVVIDTDVGTFSRNLPRFLPPPTSTELVLAAMPRGTILGWFSQTIPKGWVLCDGQNGTPKLSNQFPRGTTDLTKLGVEGGSDKYAATVTTGVPSGIDNTQVWQQGGGSLTVKGVDHRHGLDLDIGTVPKYANIAFIMKL